MNNLTPEQEEQCRREFEEKFGKEPNHSWLAHEWNAQLDGFKAAWRPHPAQLTDDEIESIAKPYSTECGVVEFMPFAKAIAARCAIPEGYALAPFAWCREDVSIHEFEFKLGAERPKGVAWEPLYAAPQNPVSEQDRRDAERLDFIGKVGCGIRKVTDGRQSAISWGVNFPKKDATLAENVRLSVDAAIAAQKERAIESAGREG